MSSIEERLARDIAAVTEGVVVTDSDLREARNDLNERIDTRRRRDRRRVVVATAAAALVLVAVGVTAFALLDDDDTSVRPAGPTPDVSGTVPDTLKGAAPSPELLHGVWRLNDGGTMVHFFSSGTVQYDDQGTLFSNPFMTGAYTVAGDTVSVEITGSRQHDCLGRTFAFRAALPRAGDLQFAYVPGSDVSCTPTPVDQGNWEQALPTRNKFLAALDNTKDPGWKPLSRSTDLNGVFLASSGGGHLLELDSDGTYYVASTESDDPIDQGHWARHGTVFTLTSSNLSTECSNGDTLTLGNVEEVFPGTTVFRGTVQQNSCGGAWTPPEWIMIPNNNSG